MEESVKLDDYKITKHGTVKNEIWIEKRDGEGMNLNIDNLWKEFY